MDAIFDLVSSNCLALLSRRLLMDLTWFEEVVFLPFLVFSLPFLTLKLILI